MSAIYDSAIDFGGHPNVKGVAKHLTYDEERDDGMVAIRLAGLHGADGDEMVRALLACLDFGLVIAAVIVLAVEEPAGEMIEGLQALSDLKNEVAEEYVA